MAKVIQELEFDGQKIIDNEDGTYTQRTTYLGDGHPIHPERRDRYVVEVPVVLVKAPVDDVVGV
jgi:hypothetical protein